MPRPKIMWFRRDLRLNDNAALSAACAGDGPVVPVFCAQDRPGSRVRGQAAQAWLARSLNALDDDLRARGSRLVVLEGPAVEAVPRLAADLGAEAVHCTRDWNPEAMLTEEGVSSACETLGVSLETHEGSLVATPGAVLTASGEPYRVFTPFYRAWLRRIETGAPLPAPGSIAAPEVWPKSAGRGAEESGGPPLLGSRFEPRATGALRNLARFTAEALDEYPSGQDFPAQRGTSEISPHLAFGEVSPWQVLRAVEEAEATRESKDAFVRQIAWRDFAYSVLDAFPRMAEWSWRPEFSAMPWRDDEDGLAAWQEGRTGFPLVDAGMRQLAATGWMHNRARMVVGSFLAKHLLIPWQHGEDWFWDSLVDYDPALNSFNWQWVAGSGADAAPYFRIFNPEIQLKKFDAGLEYVSHWVPEYGGTSYPQPIVDHREARERALAAYDVVKASKRVE